MGLDQYLYRVRYCKAWDHQPENKRPEVTLTIGGKNIPLTRPSYIKEEIMYWRKANAIHQWFVENCQGGVDECQNAYVSEEQLKELLKVCKRVLANPKKADELLPPQAGFFFGSTEIDEWYMQDLKETIKVLTEVLAYGEGDAGWDYSYEYQSSW